MTKTTYEVDYIVNIINPQAVQTMQQMASAVQSLGPGVQVLDRLNKRLKTLNMTLNNKKWRLTLDTSKAEAKISALEKRVANLRRYLGGPGTGGGGGGKGGTGRAVYGSSRDFVRSGGQLYRIGASRPSDALLGKGYTWTKTRLPQTMLSTRELSEMNRLLTEQSRLQRQIRTKYGNWQNPNGIQNARGSKAARRLAQVNSRIGNLGTGWVATYQQAPNVPAPVASASKGQGVRAGGLGYRTRGNLGYKLFGPTPLTNNGGMAIDMLKGMGIAYGIAGIGTAMSNIIQDATGYDNTMQTVENILKSHDKQRDFEGRYDKMAKTIRQVGIQTKFRVTEVADAAKFLAMAGLSVDDINTAIKPISNIALVGDTDLGETADLVTNVMTAYNMQSHQMGRAADIMTNTFTMTNTTLPEIAESYKYAASLLSAGGISFEEATAGIGILGDAGIKGSQAGTTMRTILNNIINPRGKYRKAEWADIESQIREQKRIAGDANWEQYSLTKDENGNIRDLASIFTDLASQNLSVDRYYKLFDKTAAQGAVALATHVEKWNKVIEENFMSQGMADELAEKKKNTIQGLWAQLTSSFTDDGVDAFRGVQNEIKNILRSITVWLQSDDAKEKIVDMFNAFMEFGKLIMDATKYFYKLFDTFGWFIKWMMKIQLMIWPFVKAFTWFKMLGLASIGILKTASSIWTLYKAVRALVALKGFGAAMSVIGGGIWGKLWHGNETALPWLAGVQGGAAAAPPAEAAAGPILLGPDGRPLQNTKPARRGPRWGRTAGWSNAGRFGTALGMTAVGAGIGYGVGSMIDSESGGGWGAALGGIAGAGLSLWGMSGFAGAAGLLSNPIGWGILVAGALTAVGVHFAKRKRQIEKANEATIKWKESFDRMHIASVDLTKDNGLIIANMRTYTQGLYTEQQQLEQNIETLNRYWAAKNGGEKPKDDGAVADSSEGREFSKWLERADWNTGKYDAFKPQFTAMGGVVTSAPNGHTTWTLGGQQFASTDYASLNEEEAVRVTLAQYGASEHAPLVNAENDIIKAVTSAKSASYIADRLADIRKTYLPETSAEYNDDLSVDGTKKWQLSEIMQSKWFQASFAPRIDTAIANWQPFISAMTAYENGTTLSAKTVQGALKPMMGLLFDEAQFGLVGTPQWYAQIRDLQTNYQNYHDLNGNPFTKEAAENAVTNTFSQLVQFYGKLDEKFKPMIGSFLDRSIWQGALMTDQVLPSGGYSPGQTVSSKAKDISGKTYTWQQLSTPYSIGQYGWVDEQGHQYFPEMRSGNLQLLSANGNPFTESESYLQGINFASPFAASYPVTSVRSHAPANNTTAYNWQPLGLQRTYTPLGYFNFLDYVSQLNGGYGGFSGTLAYAPSSPVTYQKPEQNVNFTGPTVKIDNVTIENHSSEMSLGQFNGLLTQSITQARNTATTFPLSS